MTRFTGFAALIGVGLAAPLASAETFTNISGASVEFPNGVASFADQLIEFSPGLVFDPDRNAETPLPEYRDGTNTLGAPDVDLAQAIACDLAPTTETCRFISLGKGGSLTVKFTDNLLTGSDTSAADLWIFEAGPADITFLDVSSDGVNWIELGAFNGFGEGIDLDSYGLNSEARLAFVRLRDDPLLGQPQGATLGADIDAIGAISTVLVPVPAAAWLFLSALALLGGRRITQ